MLWGGLSVWWLVQRSHTSESFRKLIKLDFTGRGRAHPAKNRGKLLIADVLGILPKKVLQDLRCYVSLVRLV